MADFTEDGPRTIAQFVKQFAPAFPVGTCDTGKQFEFLQQSPMKLAYVPKIVLMDKKGQIRRQENGDSSFIQTDPEKKLREALEPLIAEAGPAPAAAKAAPPAKKK